MTEPKNITAVKIPSLLRPDLRESSERVWVPGMTVGDVVAGYLADLRSQGCDDFVVQVNGYEVSDLDALVNPGDFVSISPAHGWAAVVPILIKVIIAAAVSVVSAVIANALRTSPKQNQQDALDSVSHGFSAINPVVGGNPVPIVYGNVKTIPSILNSFRRVDSGNYDMWIYALLGLGAGQTNNKPTAADVYLGEEPLTNYADYEWDATSGSVTPTENDELVLAEYFADIYHDRPFDRNLTYNDEIMIETNGHCDQVLIIVDFPYGKYVASDTGIIGIDVQIEYGYRLVGDTGSVTWDNWMCYGCSTGSVKQELIITLPAQEKYEIYLKRDTLDDPTDEDANQRSASYLISFTEILHIFQTYPGMRVGMLAVKASAKLSNSLPTISVVQNRSSIVVPGWSGSGTQTVNPSNPAWALYDALTNTHYGRAISATKIVQSTWEDWEDWADGTVEGNKRTQFNCVIDEPGNFADNCISRIEDSGRCRIVRIGDLWSVAVDKPRALSSYMFSRGNIAKDSFQWEGFDLAEQIDAIQITFHDKDRHWNKKTVLAKASWYDALTREPNISNIEIDSINNRDQAQREAIFRMQRVEKTTRYGTLRSVKFRGAGLELLDKVDVVHRSIPFGFSGCLAGIPTTDIADATEEYVAATTIYLDQTINMPTADYDTKTVILIVDGDGARKEFDITGPYDVDTTSVTISGGTFTGSRGDVWAIGRPDDDKLAYQIGAKRLNSRQEIEFDIMEYNSTIFYHSDYESATVEI